MARPTRPTAPAAAQRSDPQNFAAKAEASLNYQFADLPNWMEAMATYMEGQANAAAAGYDPAALPTGPSHAIYYPTMRTADGTAIKVTDFAINTSGAIDGDMLIRKNRAWVPQSANTMSPVGSVIAYAGVTAPPGFFICDGSGFTGMPILASVLQSWTLPDLRGEFIRGWDRGRGADPDSGRGIRSWQVDAIRNITGQVWTGHSLALFLGYSGVFAPYGGHGGSLGAGSGGYSKGFDFNAARQVSTSTENRPRNIAMNYIIKHD